MSRPTICEDMYDRILVGTDGSGSANRAVVHALELAERFDAELHGIFVVDTSVYGEPALSSGEAITHEIENRGFEYLTDIGTRANDLGIEYVDRCCHGKPHEEIVAYGDEIDADVIVLGYQGRSHTQSETLGSVTDRVIRSVGRPTLIV